MFTLVAVGYMLAVMSDITRDRVEKALVEFTGFKGDQAEIDAVMVVLGAWAAQMARDLAASPATVVEAHYHLLMQQAELLLDSGGRIASAVRLAENVTSLAQVTEGIQMTMTELTDLIERRLSATLPGGVSLAPAEPVPTQTLQEWLEVPDLPDWERDLIEGKLATRAPVELSETLKEEVRAALPDKKDKAKRKHPRAKSPRSHLVTGTGGQLLVHCNGPCGQDKPVAQFFANKKSPTGYESKCKACRRAKTAA